MRKLFIALAASFVLSAGIAGGVGAASDNANCVGQSRSLITGDGREFGEAVSDFSKANQGIGHTLSGSARTNCDRGH